jgi:hypothetical protein
VGTPTICALAAFDYSTFIDDQLSYGLNAVFSTYMMMLKLFAAVLWVMGVCALWPSLASPIRQSYAHAKHLADTVWSASQF